MYIYYIYIYTEKESGVFAFLVPYKQHHKTLNGRSDNNILYVYTRSVLSDENMCTIQEIKKKKKKKQLFCKAHLLLFFLFDNCDERSQKYHRTHSSNREQI